MRNICLTLAYDGTNYCGWQVQPNGTSVQAVVETAIKELTSEAATIFAAGRTDAGVHALGQVVNFHTASGISCDKIRSGLQRFLPDDVAVRHVREAPPDFHARYHATSKRYRYVILNSRAKLPFVERYAYHIGRRLDDRAMHDAGQVLVGRHDFRSFESHYPNRSSSVRTVSELTVARCGDWALWAQHRPSEIAAASDGDYVFLEVEADGFLYNMVRSIVGTLLKVGYGSWTTETVREILNNQDRDHSGATAPPHGLYLVRVDYDDLRRETPIDSPAGS